MAEKVLDELKNKYLIFSLRGQRFSLEVSLIKEISRLKQIHTTPNSPKHMVGVMDLRAKTIPIIDLRIKLGMLEGQPTEPSKIIVLDWTKSLTGLLVDEVEEITDISQQEIILASSGVRAIIKTDFLIGTYKHESKDIMIIDIKKILKQDMEFLAKLS